jgi:hypothetical protein
VPRAKRAHRVLSPGNRATGKPLGLEHLLSEREEEGLGKASRMGRRAAPGPPRKEEVGGPCARNCAISQSSQGTFQTEGGHIGGAKGRGRGMAALPAWSML